MSDTTDIFQRFSRCLLPSDLSAEARIEYAALARVHTLKADCASQLDDGGDSLVFVGDGAIKLVAHASDEREQVVAFYFAEDLLTVPANGAHRYSLSALRNTNFLAFPYGPFLERSQGHSEILETLLNRHALSLKRSREKTIALGRKTASERLASFLLGMAERIGTSADAGASMLLDLPMSRRDIADSLGLTIETVSRQFSLMRERGLIETQGRSGVLLSSMSALKQRSGSLQSAA
ncbi:helix-turn-helix domain-containing protein [Erythrobacter sp. W53]|uniref:helix-turn-helix domain-containing protein n=1 Tax=Erythrobacter sp. W53 TaxID=3425947 RepID=UPI003D768E04